MFFLSWFQYTKRRETFLWKVKVCEGFFYFLFLKKWGWWLGFCYGTKRGRGVILSPTWLERNLFQASLPFLVICFAKETSTNVQRGTHMPSWSKRRIILHWRSGCNVVDLTVHVIDFSREGSIWFDWFEGWDYFFNFGTIWFQIWNPFTLTNLWWRDLRSDQSRSANQVQDIWPILGIDFRVVKSSRFEI